MTQKKSTPLLDRLLDRIERLRPNKSELARILNVDRQRVYHWVTARTTEPGGEVTLALQQWADAKEVNKRKALGSAINTAKSKAHATPSSYEKRNTDPPRK
ncbi:MAG TPA: hypothetical protein VGO67_05465 [Verrucomicrobiae bacterium]